MDDKTSRDRTTERGNWYWSGVFRPGRSSVRRSRITHLPGFPDVAKIIETPEEVIEGIILVGES